MEDVWRVIAETMEAGENPQAWLTTFFVDLPKKMNANRCNDFGLIALISHAMRAFRKLLYRQISTQLNDQMHPLQFGFRQHAGTIRSITALRLLLTVGINLQKPTYLCFVDFVKVFDRLKNEGPIRILEKRGVKTTFFNVIFRTYNMQVGFMKQDEGKQLPIQILRGVRQGCTLSPILFKTYADEAFKISVQTPGAECGENLNRISYADDTVLFA